VDGGIGPLLLIALVVVACVVGALFLIAFVVVVSLGVARLLAGSDRVDRAKRRGSEGEAEDAW